MSGDPSNASSRDSCRLSLTLPEVRQGRSLVYRLWNDSQTPDSGVLFSYTEPLTLSTREQPMSVAEFLMAYDRGGHATRPRVAGLAEPRGAGQAEPRGAPPGNSGQAEPRGASQTSASHTSAPQGNGGQQKKDQ